MDAVSQWFLWLYREHGLDFTVFYDSYDRARFFKGFVLTIELSGACVVFGLAIGVLGAWLQGSHSRVTRWIVQGYVQFFRNTPPLIQLYFFYFAIGNLLPRTEGMAGIAAPPLSSFTWAVISLSLCTGSFNVEIFRSGIEAVPRSMVEAAEALGYTRLRVYMHIVFPLAFRFCLPALTGNLVNTIKFTTLAYAIAVPEMLYASAQIWSDANNVPEMMALLLVIYVGLVAVLVYVMNRVERALRIPGYV